jgi:O-antigen/teichoic acid export membrane protein
VDAASPGPRRQFGVGDAGWLGAATVLAAAGVFVVQVLAARVLTAADAANFLSFWSVVFLGYAAASGVQAELTRLVRVDQRSSGTPLLGVWAGAGVPLGVALAAFGVLFGISDSVSGTALLALSGLVCVGGGGVGGRCGATWRCLPRPSRSCGWSW